MQLIIASAKTTYAETEKKRLEELGYQVLRSRGRYWASRPISSLGEVVSVWGKEVFDFLSEGNRYPKIIGVQFERVTCHSVRHHMGYQMSGVIMVDPDDPIHTGLFPFTLKLDLLNPDRTIEVSVDQPRLTPEKFKLFLRVLTICEKEFYSPEKIVHFQGRKRIRSAKRRYLLWLNRENQLTPDLHALYGNIKRTAGQFKQTVGKLEDADGIWRRMVEAEKRLQEF